MERPVRVAVVGAGPSGMYAADALASGLGDAVDIDIIDRLPVPFGLVRYGVAPDHLSIRSVRDTLDGLLDSARMRFLGNVEVGRDLDLADLHRFYDAIVWTYGASADRQLGIPGEELDGSVAATDLVAWYTGHPDADRERFERLIPRAQSVIVVGVGNVAVDVARILAKTPEELEHTDMPQHVLDTLAASAVRDIHILGRRGPAQATFTTKELRELGELRDAEIVLDPADLAVDEASAALIASDRAVARNMAVMEEWATREPAGTSRRVHLHFLARPVAIEGDGRVERLVVERTALDGTGRVSGTGELTTIPADLVVRSVGYRGLPIGDLPFDDASGTIVSDGGRVRDGEYVAGWIRRGPSGIIGTNKKCAVGAVASLLEDVEGDRLPRATEPERAAVDAHLASRGVTPVSTQGWRAIDAAERALGAAHGKDRMTLHEWTAMLRVAADSD